MAATTAAVLATGVTKSFGTHHVLRGIDLEVTPGTVIALLGPNGAGKTTMVRILSTPLRPDGGTASVAGHDVVHEAAGVTASLRAQGIEIVSHVTYDPSQGGEDVARAMRPPAPTCWSAR